MDYRKRLYAAYCGGLGNPVLADELYARRPYLQQVIKRFIPADQDTPLLDLGCGSGTLVYLLREAGYRRVTGVDTSPKQVNLATQHGREGVEVGDAYSVLLEQRDASVGCIVTFDVIEHLRKDELLPFADQVFRVLMGGGRWLIHVPNAASPFAGRIRYGDFTHEQSFKALSIRQVLAVCGFKRVDCFEDQPIVHGLKSLLRYFGWKVVRLFWVLALMIETGSGRNEIMSQNMLAVAHKE